MAPLGVGVGGGHLGRSLFNFKSSRLKCRLARLTQSFCSIVKMYNTLFSINLSFFYIFSYGLFLTLKLFVSLNSQCCCVIWGGCAVTPRKAKRKCCEALDLALDFLKKRWWHYLDPLAEKYGRSPICLICFNGVPLYESVGDVFNNFQAMNLISHLKKII